MNSKKAKYLIATCLDFRLQSNINKWISQNLEPDTYDRVAIGGSCKNLDFLMTQVKKAYNLHQIEKVIIVNHEDCGAYGTESTPEKHAEDLRTAKSKINELYPSLEVETYYLHLNGSFEKFNN